MVKEKRFQESMGEVERLRRVERIFDSIMENLPIGITIVDAPEGRILQMSRYGRELSSRPEEETRDVSLEEYTKAWAVFHSDGVTAAETDELPLVRAVRKGEIVKREEWVIETTEGKKAFFLSACPVRDEEGNVSGGIITWEDIGALRATQGELMKTVSDLQLQKEFLDAVFEQMPSAVVIAQPAEEQPIIGNSRCSEIWRRPFLPLPRSEIHKEFKGFHPLDGRPYETDEWPLSRSIFQGETVVNEEIEILRGDGTRGTILVNSKPIQDSSGKIIAGIAVFRDVTERKQMEREIMKAKDDLEEKVRERTAELERSNQALQDFAFIASHDLQEPLRKVQSFGEILKEKLEGSVGEMELDLLERMEDATVRMGALIEDLLTYSRIATQGKPFLPVDLNNVLMDVKSDLEMKIAKTGATVEIENLPTLKADYTQMRQLFQNLLSNSLKFSKGEPVVRVHARALDHEVEILVEDNGIGFDEKQLERLFRPFQRLHGRSAYEGTGIGLAIVKKIVERHDGRITAKSAPGKGSKFIVTMPVR